MTEVNDSSTIPLSHGGGSGGSDHLDTEDPLKLPPNPPNSSTREVCFFNFFPSCHLCLFYIFCAFFRCSQVTSTVVTIDLPPFPDFFLVRYSLVDLKCKLLLVRHHIIYSLQQLQMFLIRSIFESVINFFVFNLLDTV